MRAEFHYQATYCAALLAGYSPAEALEICYSSQFTDGCSRTLLDKLHGPLSAATTQLAGEMAAARTDPIGLQDVTRIWSSFHFLPYDLHAQAPAGDRSYQDKYRLICNTNGPLLVDTVELARGKSMQAVGIAMHVLADTWAHRYFAGTPSLVINNTNKSFYEILDADGSERRPITFRHNPGIPDDIDNSIYTNSVYQPSEHAIMNLGHGRAGHLPDYSFVRYAYLPAWGNYEEIVKDNPHDYYQAFCQMVYAMKCLRSADETFVVDRYDTAAAAPWEEEIRSILVKRQLDTKPEWTALAERMGGESLPEYDIARYQEEYVQAPADEKERTFLGKYFLASLAHKSMVTNRIYTSGSMLAGISVDYKKGGFRGIRDYFRLVEHALKG